MSANPLTSNHVNYLIWRYLQESGHGEAAVKLQRDWNQDPQSLPFAQHIKTHALVLLVQKGLQYYEIEQSINQNGNHFLSKAFFGPDARQATSPPRGDASQDESTRVRGSPRARKHARESSMANGLNLDLPPSAPAAKRSRRNHGSSATPNEPTVTNGERRGSDSMDLDQNGFAHEPLEPKMSLNSPANDNQTAAEGAGMEVDDNAPEPDHPRMNLTNGPSVGVQSDRVADLGPETSVLTVPQRNVLHTAWSPTDPLLLAVAGDVLCRIWTVAKFGSEQHPSPNHPYVDIFEQGDESVVTAMDWSPNGEILAVATRSDDAERAGDVSLWSKHGKSLDSLPAAQDMLITFKWNPAGTHLLGITSSGVGSSALVIWDIRSSQALPSFPLDKVAIDVAWCDDHKFVVCGHSLVAEGMIDPYNNLIFNNQTSPELDHNWTYTRYDTVTDTVAVAAEESATLAILKTDARLRTTTAHDAMITAISFEPISDASSYVPRSPRRLASSSVDGEIRIWDTTRPFSILHVLHFGRASPPMAISFTPDGYLVAAASANRVFFWNAETGGAPKAVWRGDPSSTSSGLDFNSKAEESNGMTYMDGDSGIGEEDEGCNHSLSWDANGGKLAYGTGNQISIIRLRSQHKPENTSKPATPAPS